MGKPEVKPNKPLYIVLALLIAIALWTYVRGVDDRDQRINITDIPVTFAGEDVLNAGNLMLTPTEKQTVSLQLEGKWSVLSKLHRDNMCVRVDLQGIAAQGEHSLPYTVVYPSGVSSSNVRVLSRTPEYLSVPISLQVSKSVDLEGYKDFDLAEGYVPDGGFVFQPAAILISGEETAVANVASARVTLSREEPVFKTIQGKMNFELIGQDGQVLDKDLFTVQSETVFVTYAVTMERENIPLEVDLFSGGGIHKDDVSILSIEPAAVTLRGEEEALQRYPSIKLGLDLNRVNAEGVAKCDIITETGVTLAGDVTAATVTVDVSGFVERTKTISRDNVLPVGGEKKLSDYGLRCEGDSGDSVTITLRGRQAEMLEQIAQRGMRVVIDPNDPEITKARKQGLAEAKVYGRVEYREDGSAVFEALDVEVKVKFTSPGSGS